MSQIIPNFIGIGPQKAGSSSLYEYLRQHPEVFLSARKNLSYFIADWDLIPQVQDQLRYTLKDHEERKPDAVAVTRQSDYLEFFAAAQGYRAAGEISPAYIAYPASAPLVHRLNPSMKILAVLRNPVERAFSQFAYYRQKGLEQQADFLKAVAGEPVDQPLQISASYSPTDKEQTYLRQGFYARNLYPWFETFDQSQLKIMLFEDFRDNSRGTIQEIFRFLEVDPDFRPALETQHNKSFRPRSRAVYDLTTRPSILKTVARRLLPARVEQAVRSALQVARNLNAAPPEKLSKSQRSELLPLFADDIRQLSDMLKRDLTHWLNPRL